MTNRTYHPRGKRVHGFRVQEHPLYTTWANMLSRCYNSDNPRWADYGGRGISVCPRWHHFENFANDMGLKPDTAMSIERMDNERGYDLDNCKWATQTEQSHNRRMFSSNTSGAVGVVAVTNRVTRYLARWDHETVRYTIGRFNSVEEASAAREAFIGLFYADPAAAQEMLEEDTVWCTSSTGVRGVTPHADGGFVARTTVKGQRMYLGYFQTVEAASQAIAEAKGA